MDKVKSFLIWIVALAAIGVLGFWSLTHLKSGSSFVMEQKVKDLTEQNATLQKEVDDLTDQLAQAQAQINAAEQSQANAQVAATAPAPSPSSSNSSSSSSSTSKTYKYQSLINSLQSLSSKGITMKPKEGDASVGYVQQFLNLYFKTSTKVDNDYGTGTQKAVASFQKDQGLKSDGLAGPTTFDKMVAWLKKQG